MSSPILQRSLSWIIASILTATFAAPTWAQEDDNANKPKSKLPRQAPDDISQQVRSYKPYGVNLRVGNFIGGILGGGVDFYRNQHSHRQYGVQAMLGRHDIKNDFQDDIEEKTTQISTDKFSVDGQMVLLYARYFFTNSLAVTAGGGYRGIAANYLIVDTTKNNVWVRGTVTTNSLVANLALTSQWSWNSGFTIGCDWFGAAYPLYNISNFTTETLGTMPTTGDNLQQSADKFAEALGTTFSLQFLVLTLGYTF